MRKESVNFIRDMLLKHLEEKKNKVKEDMIGKGHSLETLEEDIKMCETIKLVLEELEGIK